MSTNKTIISGLYQAFAEGDVPTVLAALAPNVEWTEAEGFPYGGIYEGPEAILHNVFVRLGTEWEGFKVDPQAFVADGDLVVGLGLYSGTYKATGKSFVAPFAHVWELRDGKIVRFHQHTDTAVVQRALA